MSELTGMADAARDAYRRRQWSEARELFRSCRQVGDLTADDLAALADSAWWLGLVDESIECAEAAYRANLAVHRHREAAGQATTIAVNHFLRGEEAPGMGWLGRAATLLTDDPDCAEAGYLRYLTEVEGALGGPDPDGVITSARAVANLGRRLGDKNLIAAGAVGEGRVLIKQGRVTDGMSLLDGAMVAVQADELDPDWSGNIYCHMIEACYELADVRRAKQWTQALEEWLAALPAAVLFSGVCRLHRSQILHVLGDWDRALHDATQVCTELEQIYSGTAAEGHYLIGEINRLRGRSRRRRERLPTGAPAGTGPPTRSRPPPPGAGPDPGSGRRHSRRPDRSTARPSGACRAAGRAGGDRTRRRRQHDGQRSRR